MSCPALHYSAYNNWSLATYPFFSSSEILSSLAGRRPPWQGQVPSGSPPITLLYLTSMRAQIGDHVNPDKAAPQRRGNQRTHLGGSCTLTVTSTPTYHIPSALKPIADGSALPTSTNCLQFLNSCQKADIGRHFCRQVTIWGAFADWFPLLELEQG